MTFFLFKNWFFFKFKFQTHALLIFDQLVFGAQNNLQFFYLQDVFLYRITGSVSKMYFNRMVLVHFRF